MVVRLQPLEGLIEDGVFPRVAVADVSIAVDVVAHVLLVVQASVELGPTVDSLVDFRPADLDRIPCEHLNFRLRCWIGCVSPASAPMPDPFGSVLPNLHASLMFGFIGSA